jgi:hypothetical protein
MLSFYAERLNDECSGADGIMISFCVLSVVILCAINSSAIILNVVTQI